MTAGGNIPAEASSCFEKHIATRLHKEIADIVKQPTFTKVLDNLGALLAASGTAAEWGAFYVSEYQNRKALAEKLGIPVQ